MPQTIAVVISARGLATRYELQTIYGTRDLYDFIEIIAVDLENERRLARARDN